MKKPIYKKWWVWVIVVIFTIGIVGGESTEETQEETVNDPVKKEVEESIEEEPTLEKIELDKEIELDNLTINLSSVTIKDDIVTILFRWQHWASNDEVHFSVLAYVTVYQGDTHLELVGGEDSQYKKIAKGVDGFVELDYKLLDGGGPLEIKFTRTTDQVDEESIIIDID